MKASLIIAIAVASLTIGTTQARQKDEELIVTGRPLTLTQWTQHLSTQLENGLRYPRPMLGSEPPVGLVTVRFRCSDTGKPTSIELSRKSRSRLLDAAALRAVSSIKTLHPMPGNLRPEQQYEANILFATSPSEYSRQLAIMNKAASRRNTSLGLDEQVIAINGSPRASTYKPS
jgi:TonB family protein